MPSTLSPRQFSLWRSLRLHWILARGDGGDIRNTCNRKSRRAGRLAFLLAARRSSQSWKEPACFPHVIAILRSKEFEHHLFFA